MASTSSDDQHSSVEEGLAHPQTNGRAAPVERVERWPIAKLLPYIGNPKTHPPEQVELIAKSMARFGQAQLILIDGDEGPTHGEIIAGHGRVLAAAQLGWDSLAVGEARGWSTEEKRAYRIADNQLAVAPWDMSLLKLEAKDLKLGGFDMGLLGFDAPSMFALLAAEPAVDAEAETAPELPKVPVVRTGDLWVLGNHRLLCGDATAAADVARLMQGDKAVLMSTDPPYGINYGDIANSRARAADKRKGGSGKNYATHEDKEMENDDLDGPALQKFLEATIRSILPHLIDCPAFYLWHAPLTQGVFFVAAAAAANILIHREIIWVKPSLIMGRGDYHWRHEMCFYGWIKGKHCAWLEGRDQDTVWEVARETDVSHPTKKPVELFLRPIKNHTKPGEFVYEPFCGSGTQIIAAEMTARQCCALEIDPGYTQVSIERWQTYTGKEATLDGRSFEAVKAERLRSKGRSRAVGGVVPAGSTATNGKRRSRVGAKRKGSRVGSPSVVA